MSKLKIIKWLKYRTNPQIKNDNDCQCVYKLISIHLCAFCWYSYYIYIQQNTTFEVVSVTADLD